LILKKKYLPSPNLPGIQNLAGLLASLSEKVVINQENFLTVKRKYLPSLNRPGIQNLAGLIASLGRVIN
jgi:hypothetical protein